MNMTIKGTTYGAKIICLSIFSFKFQIRKIIFSTNQFVIIFCNLLTLNYTRWCILYTNFIIYLILYSFIILFSYSSNLTFPYYAYNCQKTISIVVCSSINRMHIIKYYNIFVLVNKVRLACKSQEKI